MVKEEKIRVRASAVEAIVEEVELEEGRDEVPRRRAHVDTAEVLVRLEKEVVEDSMAAEFDAGVSCREKGGAQSGGFICGGCGEFKRRAGRRRIEENGVCDL